MCLYEVLPRSGVNEIVHHSGHCHIEARLSERSFLLSLAAKTEGTG